MKTIKRIVSIVLTVIMCMGFSIPVFAASEANKSANVNQIAQIAEKYDVSESEILNFQENYKNALKQVSGASEEIVNENTVRKQVPISENLILEITTSAFSEDSSPSKAASSYYKTVTGTLSIKNIVGAVIITLNANGKFLLNGTTSKPVDAYGTYSAWAWNITNVNTAKGSAAYNSWARVTFSSELNIGIDPVSMTVQSYTDTCTIYCNAAGTYSTAWS